jgi:hypothetical protein
VTVLKESWYSSFQKVEHISKGEKCNPSNTFCPNPLYLQFLLAYFPFFYYGNARNLPFCVLWDTEESYDWTSTQACYVSSIKEDNIKDRKPGKGMPTLPAVTWLQHMDTCLLLCPQISK